jgi:hypothetical protein
MNSTRRLAFTLLASLLALSAAGCGKEIGRASMTGPGKSETAVQVSAGKKLALWTQLDVKYSGRFAPVYTVELVQDGTVVDTAMCNPLDVNVKMKSVETNFGGERKVSYSGKMKCELTPKKSGPATVKATLAYASAPPSLTVADISLVVKE